MSKANWNRELRVTDELVDAEGRIFAHLVAGSKGLQYAAEIRIPAEAA
jgi:hypothetical protein